MLCRFTDDTFNEDNAVTIGVDFKMRKITVDNNNIKLALWVGNCKFISKIVKTILFIFFRIQLDKNDFAHSLQIITVMAKVRFLYMMYLIVIHLHV